MVNYFFLLLSITKMQLMQFGRIEKVDRNEQMLMSNWAFRPCDEWWHQPEAFLPSFLRDTCKVGRKTEFGCSQFWNSTRPGCCLLLGAPICLLTTTIKLQWTEKNIFITIIYCSFKCSLMSGMCSVFLSKVVVVCHMLLNLCFHSFLLVIWG